MIVTAIVAVLGLVLSVCGIVYAAGIQSAKVDHNATEIARVEDRLNSEAARVEQAGRDRVETLADDIKADLQSISDQVGKINDYLMSSNNKGNP